MAVLISTRLCETQCWHAGCVCTLCIQYDNAAPIMQQIAEKLPPRVHSSPSEPQAACPIPRRRSGCLPLVSRRPLMPGDSIGGRLMGLICSNWKRSRSWSWGQGPPGAYCHHTSARLRRRICVCLSWGGEGGGGAALCECILRGLSAYVRA